MQRDGAPGVRSTVFPARAALYSGCPSTFTAEYVGGACCCVPVKRGSAAATASRPMSAGTAACSSVSPVTSPVSVRPAQQHRGRVRFVGTLLHIHGFGRAAHKNGQHARGHRVQRAAVPNAPRTADAAQLCHYVKGGKALRFVDDSGFLA